MQSFAEFISVSLHKSACSFYRKFVQKILVNFLSQSQNFNFIFRKYFHDIIPYYRIQWSYEVERKTNSVQLKMAS